MRRSWPYGTNLLWSELNYLSWTRCNFSIYFDSVLSTASEWFVGGEEDVENTRRPLEQTKSQEDEDEQEERDH